MDVVPTVVVLREQVQQVAPVRAPPPDDDAAFVDCATALIVRWEIGSPAQYTRKYQGVIWPGGASGPTWGIGYDGGQATRFDIGSDWHAHDQRDRLLTTSGVAGTAAQNRVRAGEWRGVTTPFPYAAQVFAEATLPAYTAAARRAVGPGFVSLPPGVRCSLVSLGYNRGWSTTGDRRREMRAIRDVCVPAQDRQCVADQLNAMCRLWRGTPNGAGLCARRADEAATALR